MRQAGRSLPEYRAVRERHSFFEVARTPELCAELDEEQALVGFCGAPFTVAGYLVEGRPSRDYARTKALMYRDPKTWHLLLDRLAAQFERYVTAQVEAGADAIQMFDSWVGV